MSNNGGEAWEMLERLGIRGLQFMPSPAILGPYPELIHLSLPFSDERTDLLKTCLAGMLL